jgi:two-component system cell cycle sensor histidine kinase/response regulator CckA
MSPSGQRYLPYFWAVAALCIGVVLRTVITPVVGGALPFITLFPAVFVAAYFGGFGPGLVATVLGIFAAFYLFIEPHFPAYTQLATQLGVLLFAVSGVATSWMGENRIRAHRRALAAAKVADAETARAEEETVRAEEEAARAEEERLRAEDEAARAEREAQRAAGQSERVERILASITDAFVALDRNWAVTYANGGMIQLVGQAPADHIGRNFWAAFPEYLGGPFERALRQAMADHQTMRIEAYYAPGDRWIGMTVYPAADGLTVVARDVTDRMRAQEANARLAAIVTSSDDAIVGKQLDGTITSWNAAAERIFGYAAADIVGRSVFTLIPPELHALEYDALRRIARGEQVEFAEVERVRADGQRIVIALMVSPIRDMTGRVVGASSIKRDITQRKRMEAALAAEGARSREFAQALDAAQVLIRTLDGQITYWSHGSAQLYGWSAAEAVGRSAHDLLQTDFPVPLDQIHAILQAEGRWEGELVHVAKDGRRLYVATQWVLRHAELGTPAGPAAGAPADGAAALPAMVIEVNTDVTAQRQAEERIRQSERMDVVGQLAGGVAHEANNQMTVVLGAADFLLQRQDLPDIARKDVEQVRAAAERTAMITAQLLAFSRRQVLQPQVFDFDEAVQGLEAMLRRAVGERSAVAFRLGAHGKRVKADPGQLAQVLLNLALNARDAMPMGGRLMVETGVAELTEHYAQQHAGVAIRPGFYAMLAVTDTGHGMSAETVRHIFEPFYTTKPLGKGTGLGLATVYGIVKQSGGYVWAYSEPGRGSTFKVYLPVEPGPVPTPPPPSATTQGHGEVVLLVEDEPSVRRMASRALREHGFEVLEAADGPEALQLVQQHDGQLHLIVTDVVMPRMDGPELARCVAKQRPELPVLFMSGYTDDDVVRRGLLRAGQPFLQKPFTPEALVQQVAELLKRRGPNRTP